MGSWSPLVVPTTDKVPPKPPLGSSWGVHSIPAAGSVQLQCWGGSKSHLGDATGGTGRGGDNRDTQESEQGRLSHCKAISLLCEGHESFSGFAGPALRACCTV